MDGSEKLFVFGDGQLLVRAGGLEPAGAEALPELQKTRAVLDDFVVRPQGCRAVGVAGAADDPPAGCEWVRLRELLGAAAPQAAMARALRCRRRGDADAVLMRSLLFWGDAAL